MKKKYGFLLPVLLITVSTFAQEKIKPVYDSALAHKLGADEYGMKMYTLVILTTGKANITDKSVTDTLFVGHMKNIQRLAAEGKLVVAGPFGKNDLTYRGVFVFNNASVEETKTLVASDPAVKAGLFDALYLPWYCSAALMEVNAMHEKLQKISF
jgi:uncharacterized protein YciI